MREPARTLLSLLAIIAVVVVAVDLVAPDGEQGTLPAELMVTLLGAVAVVQLLGAVGRRWPEAWRGRPAWMTLRLRPRAPVDVRPEPVREWEALLVTGRTGESRGRERLCRRLATVSTPTADPLLAQIRNASSSDVLELVERFTTEVERTYDD